MSEATKAMTQGDEYQQLVGTHAGRPESPGLEIAAAKAIEEAFRELIEARYFYQKVALNFSELDKGVRRDIAVATERIGRMNAEPTLGPSYTAIPLPPAVTAARLAELHREVETRPWILCTRHQGDSPNTPGWGSPRIRASQPLFTDAEARNLPFYLPAVELFCAGVCKRPRTFVALLASAPFSSETPFPRETVSGRVEQVFVPIYRCETCRQAIYTMLIRRTGGRLQLCGFAPRRPVEPVAGLPGTLAPILGDADQAIAEGDTHGALYHLRTLIEHYEKARLGKSLDEQIRGDDLCAEYYASLPSDVRGYLPSLTKSWTTLSKLVHARSGGPDHYREQRDLITKHVAAVAALGLSASAGKTP